MNDLPLAMTLSRYAVARDAHSALPSAPVVADRPRRTRPTTIPRVRRTRVALASGLRRAAAAVEPAECAPAH